MARQKWRLLSTLVSVLILSFAGCGSSNQEGGAPRTTEQGERLSHDLERMNAAVEQSVYVHPKKLGESLETELSYSVIASHVIPTLKRAVEVRLNKRVSEDELRDIAYELKARDRRSYRRTFISYYLPEMELDAGAWASTNFTPDLEVQIFGPTVEQDTLFTEAPDDLSGSIIGSWRYENLAARMGIMRFAFFRESGRIFMQRDFEDGGSMRTELVKMPSIGRVFQDKNGGGSAGEFYLIDVRGNLQLWDKEGLVWCAQKLD